MVGTPARPSGALPSLQSERSEATRATLVAVARRLFAEQGYARARTEEIVQEAGVSRGALYHHYRDKQELFEVVCQQMVAELRADVSAVWEQHAGAPFWDRLRFCIHSHLDRSSERDVQQILVKDAPSVLGQGRWREEIGDVSLQALTASLAVGERQGLLAPGISVPAAAHLLMGAIYDAALWMATAADRDRAREEALSVLDRFVDSLRA